MNWISNIDSIFHLIMLIVSIYGFCLFSWWWINKGKATAVFMYVTLAFFGEGLSSFIELYAENLGEISILTEENFHNTSLFWVLRSIPEIIAYLLIITHMSYRVFFQKTLDEDRGKITKERRNTRNDRRSFDERDSIDGKR